VLETEEGLILIDYKPYTGNDNNANSSANIMQVYFDS
jgi:hypothetical protein